MASTNDQKNDKLDDENEPKKLATRVFKKSCPNGKVIHSKLLFV